MSLIVQKFGGSSVADTHHIFNVAKKITEIYGHGNDVVIVVSAQGDTTDKLEQKAAEISSSASQREKDMLLTAGEQISASLLAMAISEMGFPAISLLGWQAGILTDSAHGSAHIVNINASRIKSELKKKKIVIVTGFQGINKNQDITTLGRGGSDTTAVALAAALNADKCLMYTDVDGVYTADPRIVLSAKRMNMVSYPAMLELSRCGAKVLSDRSVEAAQKNNVKIEVLSSMLDSPCGTIITDIAEPKSVISGIALQKNISKIIVTNIPDKSELYGNIIPELKKHKINADYSMTPIGPQEPSTTILVLPSADLQKAVEIIKSAIKKFDSSQIFYQHEKALISIVNLSESFNINIASVVFETLSESGIKAEMVKCDSARVSVLIKAHNAHTALNSIHTKLFEEDNIM